jgi:hypothetical protein
MPRLYLDRRVRFLLETQNADGGWGYFPCKRSWLEPTAYAMLALDSRPEATPALERAWTLVQSWQSPDGSWRPAADVEQPHWATALCVTLQRVRQMRDSRFVKAVDWLVEVSGAERTVRNRVLYCLGLSVIRQDPNLLGWPWTPATNSWVEPTVHALVALKGALGTLRRMSYRNCGEVEARIQMGEKMVLDRRCHDGGWNYGNWMAFGEALPSYPETTAIALLGLQGCRLFDSTEAVRLAARQAASTKSPLARAWLAICLRSYGVTPPEPEIGASAPPHDILLTALQAIGCAEGNYRLLRPEAAA